jgi:hypothetical protein
MGKGSCWSINEMNSSCSVDVSTSFSDVHPFVHLLASCCRSSPPKHVTTITLPGFPSHQFVAAAPGSANCRSSNLHSYCCCSPCYHSTSSNAVLVVWPNEYELYAFKVVSRGRTHPAIIRHAVRLSEHYNHSSSTPGRRSRTFVGVQSNEIGKGDYYY